MKNFSVCMSVYHGDEANYFAESLESILTQSLLPDEIVLVVDGPVTEKINNVIDIYSHKAIPMNIIRLSKNYGHAIARQTGLDAAQYEYIAIMDSDDIAKPDRFEKQMSYIGRHSEVDVVGGQIDEFIGTPDNVVGTREVPTEDTEIKQYMKVRCPMNLVTVIMRKSAVQQVGGYIDWAYEEDYYLWIRMALANRTFANLPECLVKVRVGSEMYKRRGGWRYFKSELRVQNFMKKNRVIALPRYIFNVLVRFAVQVMMPNWLRGFVFRTLFRK